MPADQIFCAVKFQRPRHAVGSLHSVAGKSTSDGIDSVQAHIAIIGAMQQLVLGGIAMHVGWGLTGGKHKLNLDPVYDHLSTPLPDHIGGLDIPDLAAFNHLAKPGIQQTGWANP